jgi:putative addiction module component (TIGR02574 family)
MHPTVKGLGIDRLSIAERILLVEEIWNSIADEPESLEVPESHKEELDRRIAACEADPTAGSPWPEVKARLLKRAGE